MFLKRLEIQGFKSFAKKSTLEFQPGITAIVGPNGSGKSNVADSIRWVLGEQSPKLMRGKKSEDVIFAGSDKRTGLGFAEVFATFDNTDRKIVLDAPEVSLGRRVDRSGASDYFLNGAKVRLLDIVELVLKSGIGTSRYTVIGQGTIDQLILAGPAEIKSLLDEASGVKGYYLKREKTMRRLEQTAQNLMRAKDLVAEIEPRLKSLRRLAKRQESRREVEEELRLLLINAYANQFFDLSDALKQLGVRLSESEKSRSAVDSRIESLQKEISDARTEQEQSQEGLEGARTKSKVLEDKRLELTARLAEIKAMAMGHTDHARAMFERQSVTSELSRTKAELQVAQKEVQRWQELLAAQQQQQAEIAGQLELLAAQAETDHPSAGYLSKLSQLATEALDAVRRRSWEQTESAIHKLFQMLEAPALRAGQAVLPQSEKLQKLLKQQEILGQELQTTAKELGSRQAALHELTAREDRSQRRLGELERDVVLGQSSTEQEKAFLAEQQRLEEDLGRVEAEIAEQESTWGSSLVLGRQLAQSTSEKERDLFSSQQEQSRVAEAIASLKIEQARLETHLEELKKQIIADLGAHQVEVVSRMGRIEKADGSAEKIARLRRQLEQIGGVDDLTLQEHDETETRFQTLTGQISDLEHGMADLHNAVVELDGHIKTQFAKAFDNIQEKFQHYFQILFNGGKAQLVVVRAGKTGKPEDESEAEEEAESSGVLRPEEKLVEQLERGVEQIVGVDIRATPPGKKLGSIQALSGGERALTSIALLCAMLACFPSPFVVLDEVDAALDEANTIRFGQILGTLAHQTQFVTITHNRETMAQSNILYGVTMDEGGMSKLLSLKFDQAQQFAK